MLIPSQWPAVSILVHLEPQRGEAALALARPKAAGSGGRILTACLDLL